MHRPLHLAASATAAAVFLIALAGVLLNWSWMSAADWAVLDPLYDIGAAHPGWVDGWNLLCNVLHPAVFRVLALIWIGYALLRGQYHVALFLTLTIEASALVVLLAKVLVDRPRPATALVDEMSSSFPSGHALGAAVAATALLIAGWDRLGRWRTTAVVIAVLCVLAVGIGRVVLNVHHPSDVLAGWALGYLWVMACLPVLRRAGVADETLAASDSGS
ncbi:phosphatase PAP2 family protein [Mycolicibacterium bacteremicum]|uniref:Phosphatase PAP2 family protein n=1 Tax=Mycolicibacterium bacteremicum TaxID=564198 RepID=A0A1W9Z168_MYCBA|nr:phosphatase PAP2 family protein [Mycolicibacterium bacteremicum]MCV7432331.1 phosphatase PAP2 family protein [Mycolicibacterium bacteremicum]ORA06071.1 phosphatase PAP2 family protein [Mycolicibacterium bacteremicum]